MELIHCQKNGSNLDKSLQDFKDYLFIQLIST